MRGTPALIATYLAGCLRYASSPPVIFSCTGTCMARSSNRADMKGWSAGTSSAPQAAASIALSRPSRDAIMRSRCAPPRWCSRRNASYPQKSSSIPLAVMISPAPAPDAARATCANAARLYTVVGSPAPRAASASEPGVILPKTCGQPSRRPAPSAARMSRDPGNPTVTSTGRSPASLHRTASRALSTPPENATATPGEAHDTASRAAPSRGPASGGSPDPRSQSHAGWALASTMCRGRRGGEYIIRGGARGRGMERMTEGQAAEALAGLDGWGLDGSAIIKEFKFDGFRDAFAFMSRAAFEMEEMNHHAEWTNVYNRITVRLSTHDAGGLTSRDFELARRLDGLA
ncbi:Putative pterin-4-alpha-carbinolamine dehydratase (modular protein) [Nitrosopumilaceae archaeon]|nr:Putative pterin-4-alpha-carbinolamine dehydratase (modular protein) [Nitrosopumilaceae archaeon]